MPVTDQQFNALCERIDTIDTNIDELLHGNGRTGLHALIDDFYGPNNRARPGIIARVVLLETEVRKLAEQRKETKWMQRGIAIGVGLVALDTIFNLDIARLLGSVFGGH